MSAANDVPARADAGTGAVTSPAHALVEPATSRRALKLLRWAAVAFAVSWLIFLGNRALFNPDEGRYAEIPREMLASGNWIVPHLDGVVYIEKPPLQYWATAVSYALFGQHVWSARLYSGLCGLLTVLIIALFARRWWDADTGWRAGIMGGSSMLVVLIGHMLLLDMSLTFYMTLTIAAFCTAQDARTGPRAARRWMWLAWAAAAGAFLTKGLIAGVLPVLSLIVYSLLNRDFRPWKRLSIGTGVPLFVLLTAPWFVLIQRAVPQFFDFFIIREHFERYLTRVEHRYQPWWFFIPILALGCLPWLVPAARSIAGGWRRSAPRGQFDTRRFLWVWCVVVFLFFSASDSKLIPYVLPILPALALLMASRTPARLRTDLRITGVGLIAAGAALIVYAALQPHLLHGAKAVYFIHTRWPVMAMGVIAAAAGIALPRLRAGGLAQVATVGAAGYLCFLLVLWAARAVAPIYSGAQLARSLPPQARTGTIFSVRTYDQTLPFYLGRTVKLVDVHGELEFGLQLDPRKDIPFTAFQALWRAAPQAYAVMQPPTYAELRRDGLPMVLRTTTPRRLLVSRR